MSVDSSATWLLEQETRALLTRLASVQPFVLQETLLAAAALSPAALSGIEQLRSIRQRTRLRAAWDLWDRWISEIVADFWSISRIGIGSTLGLIGLVSLPRGLVFRPSDDDPHPMPWVRVLLSCAIGDRLYPDPQWGRLAATWRAMYPLAGLPSQLRAMISDLGTTMPELVSVIVEHRPARLRGWSLGEVLRNPELHREALLRRFAGWEAAPSRMTIEPPTIAFAVLGQARASGRLSPEREGGLLRRLIASWAVRSSLETARATARAEAEMFVGQPVIWADLPGPTGRARHTPLAQAAI